MSERIVVGLSGGVDSALAAALLQERGFVVTGCFLKVAITGAPCPWEADLPMAHRVAAHLNIPLIVKDVSVEYEREVLKPMIAAYQRGETPNPDTTCNRYVKFNALAAVAREVGAERIATGHYARVKHFSPSRGEGEREGEGIVELHRALDHVKDQSYFLWQLTQEQLSMCEFPIGEWRKNDVRADAKRRGFPNWDRDSTSGVCFLGHVNLTEFLNPRILPERSAAELKGHINLATVVTTTGETIGTIPNAEALTIGQRVPLAGQSAPHYVTSIWPKLSFGQVRRVVVSAMPDDPARYTKTITTGAPHWIGIPPALPFSCTARIRHRQEPVPCTVEAASRQPQATSRSDADGLRITFDTALTGVAPGQAVVLTDDDRVLGGAVIDRRLE